MSRKKMVRFAENEVNPNVIQAGKPIFEEVKGRPLYIVRRSSGRRFRD